MIFNSVCYRPVIIIIYYIYTYAISAYDYKRCEFDSRSDEMYSIQHYVITFVSDLRQVGGVFSGYSGHQ